MSFQKFLSAKFFLIGATTGAVIASLAQLIFFFPNHEQLKDGELTQQLDTLNPDSASLTQTNTHSHVARSVDQKNRPDTNPNESLSSLVNDDIADVGQLIELLQVSNEMWLEQGISALQQIYDSVSDSAVRESVIGAILHQATKDGHEKAFVEALDLNGSARRWILHEIVTDWAQTAPQATVDAVWALASTDPSMRMLQRRAVWEWAEIEPRKMLANMDAVPDNMRDFAQEKALFALARIDPETAVGYFPSFAGSSREATLANEIAEHWATLNPSSALAWVENYEFSTPELRRQVFETTFRTYAQVDPHSAFQTALKHPRAMGRIGMESISSLQKSLNQMSLKPQI